MHVEKFFARNLGGLIHARTRVPGRLGKATSRTSSMYVDEKSDEAIVLAKRLNKGRQLPAEVVEGRASPATQRLTVRQFPSLPIAIRAISGNCTSRNKHTK